ncbi:MAG: alkaline phosphatase family protein, partial [Thermoanaerobaculia bacterium]
MRGRAAKPAELLTLLSLLTALTVPTGCSIHNRTESALKRVPVSPPRSVCVLFFDGLSHEAFEHLVTSGALPNMKRELVDRGLVVDTAVASIPSETYPNLSGMLTGLFPGHHGIPANVWLDRRMHHHEAHTNIFRTWSAASYLEPEARTLYERLPADTVAVTTPIAKGATVQSKNLVSLMASFARNDWTFLDRKTIDDVGDAYVGAFGARKLPSLVWGHLLGPDEVAHSDGPDSAAFRMTMSSADRAFGRLVRRLKRRGIYDHVLFVLIGDHGNAPYTQFVDADELVHRALFSHPAAADCITGDCTLVTPPPAGKGHQKFDVGNAQIAVGAYRGVMIWLPATRDPENIPLAFRNRKGKGRKQRSVTIVKSMPPPSSFAAALAQLPEIEIVVTRGAEAGQVEIYGAHGRGLIVREDFENRPSRYRYEVLEGIDPTGYATHEAVKPMLGGSHSADEWLDATLSTSYPDLVVQLAEYFDSPRAPDVYFSPKDGFGFKAGKAAGHGGLARREMIVPLIFAGPGVVPGHRKSARSIDLAPTLLQYLGVPF